MKALHCLAVVGLLAGVSVGSVEASNQAGKTKQVGKTKTAPGKVNPGVAKKNNSTAKRNQGHTIHGVVTHVDHKKNVFTVRVLQNQNGGKTGQHHHEQKFHVTGNTKFDFGAGKGQKQGSFSALKHGEHVVVHTNGQNHASRVDIQRQHQTNQKGGKTRVVRR